MKHKKKRSSKKSSSGNTKIKAQVIFKVCFKVLEWLHLILKLIDQVKSLF